MNKKDETRYVRGAVISIFLTPFLIYILMFIVDGHVLGAPITILLGASLISSAYAAPFILVGALIYMLVERFTTAKWWHAALIGAGLMATFFAIISQQLLPESSNQWHILGIMCAMGILGATIFWYFARPRKAQSFNE